MVLVSILGFAQWALQDGGDTYFNDVFLGNRNAYFGGGSHYRHVICERISRMLPFRDSDLVRAIRDMYPSQKTLDLLGPTLAVKVILPGPLFRWVAPEDEDGRHHFDELPHPLEQITDDRIRKFGWEVFSLESLEISCPIIVKPSLNLSEALL